MASAKNRASCNSRIARNLPPDKYRRANTAQPTRTAGELFADGAALELIRDAQTCEPNLLLSAREKCHVARRIETHGRVFEPLELDASIVRAVTWPTACLPYGSTRKLFNEVSELIASVARASDLVKLTAFFLFANWMLDLLPLAPLLWVVVPPTAPADALFRLLLLLCRRGLAVAEFTTAGLRSLPMELRPTILTEVTSVQPALISALRASNRRGTYVLGRGRLTDIFCSKVVFANQPLHDPASIGFPLEVALAPTREDMLPMNLAAAEHVAAELRCADVPSGKPHEGASARTRPQRIHSPDAHARAHLGVVHRG